LQFANVLNSHDVKTASMKDINSEHSFCSTVQINLEQFLLTLHTYIYYISAAACVTSTALNSMFTCIFWGGTICTFDVVFCNQI